MTPVQQSKAAAQWKPYTSELNISVVLEEGGTKYVTILAYADNDGVPSETVKVEYVFSKPEPVLCPEFMLADEKGEPIVETLNISLGETFVAPQVVLLTEGFKFSVSYSSSNEEVATVNYSVTQKTFVVIYLEATSGAAAPARIARSEKEEGAGAYVYAIKITPKSAPTGIDLTPSLEGRAGEGLKILRNGVLYIVHDGKILDATGKLVK